MARTLNDKLAALDPARRAGIEAEADRLQAEYLTLRELRKARELTQVQLAETLGIQQATVARYERQSDLLLSTLSTLSSYVRAMGGSLKLMVEFPGRAPVALDGLGETEKPHRCGRAKTSKR
ncbi:helix-turn-helix transcriptional regulator [Rhodovulum visakhapatnamense]|uniref:Helix-turn-helix protein n=1 Tax=Rhodovulum visakhapatnamense TaxID=364297 RepID=A0A4R8F3S0_9RHOB|nr:helix-turn-helix transcriptional regulator [Rhodovulum visakhapatnamense]TDX19712.1 helix-turn-helix protein [Rhodovulum visakhapatnamense]